MILQTVVNIVSEEKCTGCSACMNICPTNAIHMEENTEGFLMPQVFEDKCISCNACLNTCPVLNLRQNNNINPDCFAFRADDATRQKSSSGGFFSAAARVIFSQNGKVFGACFDSNHICSLHMASNEDELNPMRGAKYLQANIGYIYREIVELLNNGSKVLFTGTPCQVAGLRGFLNKDYENLLLVDILCFGVAPQKVFRKYISEIAQDRKITNISFRDKLEGWRQGLANLRIHFSDGSSYSGSINEDTYLKSYFSNMIMRKSCADCPFCEYPRQGDISMGDFWGLESLTSIKNDNKGTSIIFVNNKKGTIYIENIKRESSFIFKCIIDTHNIPNRVSAKKKLNIYRDRFLDLIYIKNFNNAYQYCLNDHYDVGIVGPYTNNNLGGFLTYFALYHIIKDLGYAVEMIECPKDSPWGNLTDVHTLTEKSVYPNYDLAPQFNDISDMRKLNVNCDQFVVGSDQIFRPTLFNGWGKVTELAWVEDCKKKIAYAASFGFGTFECDNSLRAEMSYFLRKFDAFSVREKSAIKICRDEIGIDAVLVLDPVFLCNHKYYHQLAKNSEYKNKPDEKFLHAYIMSPTKDKQKIIEKVCEIKSIPYHIYAIYSQKAFDLKILNGTPNSRMRDMIDCDFSITDSFHGICFAIIFRKDFIAIPNVNHFDDRIDTILSLTGLNDRLVKDFDDFQIRIDKLLSPIDFDLVYAKINPLIQQSRTWLSKHLEKIKIKPFSDYDMLMNIRQQLENKFTQKFNSLQTKIDGLMSLIPESAMFNLAEINDFYQYIISLCCIKSKIIILISAKDTPSPLAHNKDLDIFSELGLQTNFNKQFRKPYLAIIKSGKIILEKLGIKENKISFDIIIDNKDINLFSESFSHNCKSSIIIDDNEYSINKRGLNFVILNKYSMDVLDCVCFDTFLPNIPALRKANLK